MQTSMKDFQVINKLGEGSFSCVFKVKRLSDNQEYALKKVKMSMLSEKEKENALNEVRILASISNLYIIGYKEAFFDESTNSLCVIMEYANGGDIQKKISEKLTLKSFFSEKEIWKALYQMTKGLKTLHEKKILHRDLKCANVFLTAEGNLKLGDLNVSKVAKQGLVHTQTGTPYYASPEVWRDQPYDMKSDIWSLGCVIYEMAALKPPFRANDMQGLYNKVQKGIYERIPNKYSNELASMIGECLQVNPIKRPNCDEILNNKLIKSVIEENEEENNDGEGLLCTIKLPKNLRLLQDKLPKANYKKKDYQKKMPQEMENLYSSPSLKQNRILSAGLKRSESNSEIPNKQILEEKNNFIKKEPEKINYLPSNQVGQAPSQVGLPPRPANYYINRNNIYGNNNVAIKNNVHQIINNSPNQQNIKKPPIPTPITNQSPVNYIQKNVGVYQEYRPISKGNNIPQNNSRDSSQEKKNIDLHEKLAQKERNLFSNNPPPVYVEPKKSHSQNPTPNVYGKKPDLPNNNSNQNIFKPSGANELKKHYEEVKIETPVISNVKDLYVHNKNYPKSAKNIDNLAAGQIMYNNKISKPSWWG